VDFQVSGTYDGVRAALLSAFPELLETVWSTFGSYYDLEEGTPEETPEAYPIFEDVVMELVFELLESGSMKRQMHGIEGGTRGRESSSLVVDLQDYGAQWGPRGGSTNLGSPRARLRSFSWTAPIGMQSVSAITREILPTCASVSMMSFRPLVYGDCEVRSWTSISIIAVSRLGACPSQLGTIDWFLRSAANSTGHPYPDSPSTHSMLIPTKAPLDFKIISPLCHRGLHHVAAVRY
jgi:hypothetical protein